ncbi:hypothetical protein F4680DRAFT_212003 [Xylaria scruposa]|nr:hypothetical protein F4680DRAFT_212003 [Xylaria scruposa]
MGSRTPQLSKLMPQGFGSGLRWETQGYKTQDTKGQEVHIHRFLLHHPHSTHLAETFYRSLGTRSKSVIGECLSEIYYFAADNAYLCKHMEPEEFWARAKNSREWSANFDGDAFWAFTYKLFHARALYLHTIDRAYYPKGQPLINALDHFQDTFYKFYAPKYIFSPTKTNAFTQDQMSENRRVCESYFRYTWHGSEGDGTDHKIMTTVQDEDLESEREGSISSLQAEVSDDDEDERSFSSLLAQILDDVDDPKRARSFSSKMLLDESSDDGEDFDIDLGSRNTRYGRRHLRDRIVTASIKHFGKVRFQQNARNAPAGSLKRRRSEMR